MADNTQSEIDIEKLFRTNKPKTPRQLQVSELLDSGYSLPEEAAPKESISEEAEVAAKEKKVENMSAFENSEIDTKKIFDDMSMFLRPNAAKSLENKSVQCDLANELAE